MKDFKKIRIVKIGDADVLVHNPTRYPLIGKGKQGAVFKLSSNKCVKIFWRNELAQKESDVYEKVGDSKLLPDVYKVGHNYIVMEYIPGTTLKSLIIDETLEHLPIAIVEQIINMFKEMKRLGFSRIDVSTGHVIITDAGNFKLIDHANSLSKHQPFPQRLFNKLRRYEKLKPFLADVRQLDEQLFEEWKKLAPNYFENH
ncbi:RIO1 family regulatory kinase/ATPase [Fredinandcohnia humi]